MTIDKLFGILEDGPDSTDEFTEMTEEELMENLPKFSMERLSDLVIANRYLGLYSKLSTAAMRELANRRAAGDMFDYESYIDSNMKDLPKISLDISSLSSLFNMVKEASKK